MKKYVTLSNKENTDNILLLNTFLYTKNEAASDYRFLFSLKDAIG